MSSSECTTSGRSNAKIELVKDRDGSVGAGDRLIRRKQRGHSAKMESKYSENTTHAKTRPAWRRIGAWTSSNNTIILFCLSPTAHTSTCTSKTTSPCYLYDCSFRPHLVSVSALNWAYLKSAFLHAFNPSSLLAPTVFSLSTKPGRGPISSA